MIRLEVERLLSGAIPKPVWLWHSRTSLDQATVDLAWQAFLRRFDIEHTIHMLKQPSAGPCRRGSRSMVRLLESRVLFPVSEVTADA